MTDLESMTAGEVIQHFGTKGMHWGVRKDRSGPRIIPKAQITAARKNIKGEVKALKNQRKVVRKADAADKVLQKTKYNSMKTALLKNPDRVTALRMTKGESALMALFAATGSPTLPATIMAKRKTIEKRQRTGYYDRKTRRLTS